MKYKKFKITAWFGENVNEVFEIVAIDLESALNDIRESRVEEITFYQWGEK